MGLTNTEAAAISFGSTLGMLGLNKWTNIGEVFFDEATDDAVKLARQAVKAEMKDALQMFKSIKSSNLPEPNKYLKMIKVASDKVVDVFNQFGDDLKYHTLNLAGKAIGEGLEEVSEGGEHYAERYGKGRRGGFRHDPDRDDVRKMYDYPRYY